MSQRDLYLTDTFAAGKQETYAPGSLAIYSVSIKADLLNNPDDWDAAEAILKELHGELSDVQISLVDLRTQVEEISFQLEQF